MSERVYLQNREAKKPKQKKNEIVEVKNKNKKVSVQNNNINKKTSEKKTSTNNTSKTESFKSSILKNTTWKRTIPFMPTDWENNIPYYVEQGKKNKYRNLEFEKILGMKQNTLRNYVVERLISIGYGTESIIEGNGYVFAEGDFPVLLVAHMDTVHLHTPFQFIYKDEYLFSPQGIGGDDRCGIWMILNIIQDVNCSVLFTEDEEIGCVGAEKFCRSKVCDVLKETNAFNYIIELDRRGKNDCVFYDCDNFDFEDFVIDASGGYFNTQWGSCSDISYVAPKLGVAAVNLSCGYYQEHCLEHYINLKEMNENIEKVKEILNYPKQEFFEYISVYKSYGNYYSKGNKLTEFYSNGYKVHSSYDDYDDYDDDWYYEDYYGKRYYNDDYYNFDCRDYGNGYSYDKYGYNQYGYKEKETKQIYHIQFIARDTTIKTAEVKAKTEDEAVGIFMKAYLTVCYDDIVSIKHGVETIYNRKKGIPVIQK